MKNTTDIRSYTVDEDSSGARLDVFLAEQTGLSRTRIKSLITGGNSEVVGGKKPKPSYPVEQGDVINITVPEIEEPDFLPENIPLDIIFEDEHLLVVNKPAGMVVHPGRGNFTGTLASGLLYHCKSLSGVGEKLRPGIVHRIDMDTSGLLVVALNSEAHGLLSEMIRKHEVKRIYTALVWGHPDPASGTIDAPLGRHPSKGILQTVIPSGREAVTHYTVTAHYDFLSKLSITLETGRTHQIRVHLAHIGHHVFGDPYYGGRDERLKGFSPDIRLTAKKLLKNISRQTLHAERLEFSHPVTGEDLAFEAPLPDDILSLVTVLDK
jgi:23S rRNA pseudouridine1911/1915/1917 synthase